MVKVKSTPALWALLATVVAVCTALTTLYVTRLGSPAQLVWIGIVATLVVWFVTLQVRRLMWRVGGRLALTYFLIGVLPIPMVVFLLFAAGYILSGFFLGHLYRDAFSALHQELLTAAETRLAAAGHRFPPLPGFAFGYYQEGRFEEGDQRAPGRWPDWLATPSGPGEDHAPPADRRRPPHPLVVLEDGTQTLAVAVERRGFGVVAFWDGALEAELSRRCDVDVRLMGSDDRRNPILNIEVLGVPFVLQLPQRGETGLLITGSEVSGNLLDFTTGELVSRNVSAVLSAAPSVVFGNLLSSSREVDTLAWLGFFLLAFLLLDIYGFAVFLAVRMIVGLSRAVNRLSHATASVQAGDFSTRIEVRRRDQVGALHRSFNEMAANLEQLVAATAQKEALDKELDVARELQKSLLPSEVVQGEGVEFATFFEPSAAIGGDYFDILQLDPQRLAIVIADVAGHGLSAGLRMAMLKAALLILVEEGHEPHEILGRLDSLVRSSPDQHPSLVTSTLSRLDLESGRLELTNAGHPPTYLLHNGDVEEILLPSAPLGALGHSYRNHTLTLEPGDTVVWLSDGFIEATNSKGEPFGYEQTLNALRGESLGATATRDRLLTAVEDYTVHQPAEDDRTLVVMCYQPTSSPSSE